MDDYQLVILAFLIYAAIELVFRFCVLFCTSGKESIFCLFGKSYEPYKFYHLINPILSPGLWVSGKCKEAIKEAFSISMIRKEQLSIFIKTSNCWNLIFSVVLLFVITFCREWIFLEVNDLVFLACFMWRYISRSFEIAIAFGRDVLSPDSSSNLDNHERMWLAIKSYFEIFIYSAAFYSAFSCKGETIFEPILTSLFVGTLTNISGALELLINCCEYDLFYKSLLLFSVYIQVFATLSLIFFGFAGYLSRVKSNTINTNS